jgi:hypothetical protein
VLRGVVHSLSSLSSPSAPALRLHTGHTTVSGIRPPTVLRGGVSLICREGEFVVCMWLYLDMLHTHSDISQDITTHSTHSLALPVSRSRFSQWPALSADNPRSAVSEGGARAYFLLEFLRMNGMLPVFGFEGGRGPRERVCCLLALNSVTSTPQWIRQPKPRGIF